MNWTSVLTHFAAIVFGGFLMAIPAIHIFKLHEEALADADDEIDALTTKLLAEKAENDHLIKDVAYLNDRLRPFIMPRARDARGHFLKVAA